jgi:phenylpyruvate tautomerase PptA (4-oxalocrotonate tautomerase family)
MPILDIEIVTRSGETVRAGLAAEIANRAGKIFESAKGGTWVKLHLISPENYAENGAASDDDICPVFVTILKSRLPNDGAMKSEVAALTKAIAKVCNRPAENVHIIYEPSAAGRVAFGGKVIEL